MLGDLENEGSCFKVSRAPPAADPSRKLVGVRKSVT